MVAGDIGFQQVFDTLAGTTGNAPSLATATSVVMRILQKDCAPQTAFKNTVALAINGDNRTVTYTSGANDFPKHGGQFELQIVATYQNGNVFITAPYAYSVSPSIN